MRTTRQDEIVMLAGSLIASGGSYYKEEEIVELAIKLHAELERRFAEEEKTNGTSNRTGE